MTPEQIEQALNAAFRAWGQKQSRTLSIGSHLDAVRDTSMPGFLLQASRLLPVDNSPALAAGAFSQGV